MFRVVTTMMMALLMACGSNPGAGPGADAGTPSPDGGTVGSSSLQLDATGPTIQSGGETTWCVVKRLSNSEKVLVDRIETTLSAGSHHLIVYRSDETNERVQPFQCTPFTETLGGQAVPLLISQLREEQLQLPTGVVFELQPNQMVRVEAHYLNVTGSPINTKASVSFHTVEDTGSLQRAGFLFFGTPDISLDPMQSETVGPYFVHQGIPAGAKIFAMTTHTHQYGTQFRVEKATSRTAMVESIYDYPNWQWDEPPVKQFDPPMTFNPGEGVRFTCEYTNTSGQRVDFGESANEEMCFLWLYYYPDAGYRICIDTNYGGSPRQLCCPGDPLCALLPQFL